MNISSPTSPKPPDKKSFLFIGPGGGGKTTVALQFPDPAVIDCDTKLDGPEQYIRARNPNLTFGYDSVALDKKTGKPLDMEKCWDAMMQGFDDLKVMDGYRTGILDNLTMVNKFMFAKILGSKDAMEMRDWGKMSQMYGKLLITKINTLPMTRIVICHDEPVERANPSNPMLKEVIRFDPIVYGETKHQIASLFTDVWRFTTRPVAGGKVERRIQTTRDTQSDLKNSFGMPPRNHHQ